MVQEVQAEYTWYIVPNRIEGIWLSERRIKEHYQITPAMTFGCEATSTIDLSARSDSREAPEKEWEFSLTTTWTTEFTLEWGWIRVPQAWWYSAILTLEWASSNWDVTATLKVWNEVIYTGTYSNSSSTKETVLNLWKFDVIKFVASWYYNWSATSSSTTAKATVKLQKI